VTWPGEAQDIALVRAYAESGKEDDRCFHTRPTIRHRPDDHAAGRHADLLQGLGLGTALVLSHGWPLTADTWEAQMFFLASNGYRCIGHDRKVYPGGTHSLGDTSKEQLNADLLAFIKG
jgi:pimeloyl-ACP methyl ester carboxylesterase